MSELVREPLHYAPGDWQEIFQSVPPQSALYNSAARSQKEGRVEGYGKRSMDGQYSLHDIFLICKLFVIEAKLLNKIGRHLLHLIIRKGLANPGPMIMI